MKIHNIIRALRSLHPHRSPHGQLYRDREQLRRTYRVARMHVIMQSEDADFRLHQTIFHRSAGKNPAAWGDFFRRKFREIYVKDILAYMHRVTEKNWQVTTILGWVGQKPLRKQRVKRKSRNPKVAKKRHKAKRQRTKRGKNHLRGRHRNRRRKA